MTMTAREAFEKGTATFNSHDIDGFAEVLADDVVFTAQGGTHGEGKEPCAAFFGSWFAAFPDAHVDFSSKPFTSSTMPQSRRAHSLERKTAFSAVPWGTFHQLVASSKWTTSKCSAFATASMCRLI